MTFLFHRKMMLNLFPGMGSQVARRKTAQKLSQFGRAAFTKRSRQFLVNPIGNQFAGKLLLAG